MGSIMIAVWSVAICATLFAGYYGVTSHWPRSWVGRALFTLSTIIMVWFWFGIALAEHWWAAPPIFNFLASWGVALGIDAAFLTLLISDICARIKHRRARPRKEK